MLSKFYYGTLVRSSGLSIYSAGMIHAGQQYRHYIALLILIAHRQTG